jgi:transposase-like protein
VALLSEKTLTAAARRCGVNEKTLRRWMADDEEFKSAMAEARHVMFQAGLNRVQALAGEAINTLEALMGRGVPPTVRLGAARTLAELGIHQHDADTILRKLDEIESYQLEQDAAGKR